MTLGIEPPPGEETRLPRCANCDARLTGPYCAQCGQHAHVSARALGALLHDGWHVLTHLDGRLWRTLYALVAQPGRLTVEYFLDHRERYLPPVRLYLILSLVFFAFVNIDAGRIMAGGPAAAAAPTEAAGCQQIAGADTVARWLRNVCQRVADDNGASLLAAMRKNVPRMMFVFLPVLAAVLKLLYWRPRRLYVEHLVFFLHSHAAMFIAILAMLLADWLSSAVPAVDELLGLVLLALTLYIPWYLYRAMRTFYGQGRKTTIAKLLLIVAAYSGCLAGMMALTFVFSVFTG